MNNSWICVNSNISTFYCHIFMVKGRCPCLIERIYVGPENVSAQWYISLPLSRIPLENLCRLCYHSLGLALLLAELIRGSQRKRFVCLPAGGYTGMTAVEITALQTPHMLNVYGVMFRLRSYVWIGLYSTSAMLMSRQRSCVGPAAYRLVHEVLNGPKSVPRWSCGQPLFRRST